MRAVDHIDARRQVSSEVATRTQSVSLDRAQEAQPSRGNAAIVLIEPRGLIRECLIRCLQSATGYPMVGYASVGAWLQHAPSREACLVILSSTTQNPTGVNEQFDELTQAGIALPVVVLSDSQEPDHVFDLMERGATGLVSSDITLDVAVQALRLVIAGGVYIPANCVLAAWRHSDPGTRKPCAKTGMFTARQAAVVEALRKGKANKVIAYELDMRESTVKVHVRNIMKKLNARNRTEVAYLTNATQILPSGHASLLNGTARLT